MARSDHFQSCVWGCCLTSIPSQSILLIGAGELSSMCTPFKEIANVSIGMRDRCVVRAVVTESHRWQLVEQVYHFLHRCICISRDVFFPSLVGARKRRRQRGPPVLGDGCDAMGVSSSLLHCHRSCNSHTEVRHAWSRNAGLYLTSDWVPVDTAIAPFG